MKTKSKNIEKPYKTDSFFDFLVDGRGPAAAVERGTAEWAGLV